jgi:hypothetical protein
MWLLAIGSSPVAAAVQTCNDVAYFTASVVYLGVEHGTDIWSTPVIMHAYCGGVGPEFALADVRVTNIRVASNGTIPGLMASVDGSAPATLLTKTGVDLNMPPNVVTDSTGAVQFMLRAMSTEHPFLAKADASPQLIGMHFESAVGNGGADPATYELPFEVGGGVFAATPELDSLVLFGSGAAGLAGYALMRFRGRRRT